MMVIMRAIGIMRVRSMRERGREQEREWGCGRRGIERERE